MKRRSLWDRPEVHPKNYGTAEQSPRAVVEQLQVVRKKRSRDWERANRAMLVRGVPPGLVQSVKEVAVNLEVRTDDVARAFLEFSLLCYEKGEIQVEPVFSNQRLTLFPRSDSAWARRGQPGWIEKLWDYQPPGRKTRVGRKPQEKEKRWKQQVSYRGIPAGTQERMRKIHREKQVPLGEVVTLLLAHAFEAYQQGRLVLRPQVEPC